MASIDNGSRRDGGAGCAERLAATERRGYAAEIEAAYGRMREREAAAPDADRPRFHLAPLAGTLADPNGLAQVGDIYHLMHLNNPLACETSERTACVWAHWTTRDFVHWRREPVALYPDTARDRDGVYSGSALVRGGHLAAYYTGNVRHHGDYDYIHAGREQNVIVAEAPDDVCFAGKRLLMTNDDYPADLTQHVRDPQLVDAGGETLMLLGARTQDDVGCVLVYRALDGGTDSAPERFALAGRLCADKKFGYMWECPDLVSLGGREFLLACPQGIAHERYRYQNAHQCGYFELAGSLAQAVEKRAEAAAAGEAAATAGGSAAASLVPVGAFTPWDYGFDFYAARTLRCADGRVLLIGWMGMPDAPYGRTPTAERGWDQVLAMPRELELRGGRLYQRPLRELAALRGEPVRFESVTGGASREGAVDRREACAFSARSFELDLRFSANADFAMGLREDATLTYRAASGELVLSLGPITGAGREERCMLVGAGGLRRLEVFVDASTLEVFVNDGEATITSRLFGASDQTRLERFCGTGTFWPMGAFTVEEA